MVDRPAVAKPARLRSLTGLIEIATDEQAENEQEFAGSLYAPLRKRGHSREGRDNWPQVIIAFAVTCDGMPVHSLVLPGNTADVTTVARIKDDLPWRLGRFLFVGDRRDSRLCISGGDRS
jgi:transposase